MHGAQQQPKEITPSSVPGNFGNLTFGVSDICQQLLQVAA